MYAWGEVGGVAVVRGNKIEESERCLRSGDPNLKIICAFRGLPLFLSNFSFSESCCRCHSESLEENKNYKALNFLNNGIQKLS